MIKINIFNEKTILTLNGKQYDETLQIKEIKKFAKRQINIETKKIPITVKFIRNIAKSDKIKIKYKDAYVIIDRDTQADDNAEHFYRYLKKNQSDLNIFFILSKTSHDYKRLEDEGFNLLPFDSLNHKCALLNAKYLISSHADKYVVDYLKPKFYADLITYKFVFLQHGVIRDDISTWLNNKNIDLFITSMYSEYDSIAGDSKYKFTKKEVVLTGLSRHDRLIERKESTENVILIMPTWRNSLVGDLKNMSAQREVTDAFYESDYAKHWKSFLHSSKFKELVDKYEYKVVFFPHVNMSIYIDWFDAPSWIEVRTHKTDPILHKLFRRSKVMITDYSSVFFEMAILEKSILYYQFDFEYMYGGNHSSQLGYFDFEKDGFGAVSYKEKELLLNLENILQHNGKPNEKYHSRMLKALPFRDGKNRERTLNAIKNLDNNKKNTANASQYLKYLKKAQEFNHCGLMQFCLYYLTQNDNNKEFLIELIKSEINLGNVEIAKNLLSKNIEIDTSIKNNLKSSIQFKENQLENISISMKELLLNNEISNLTSYINIEKVYKSENWSLLFDIFSFVTLDNIPKEKQSKFYYIWAKTLKERELYQKAIECLEKIKEEKIDNIEINNIEFLKLKAEIYEGLNQWSESLKIWKSFEFSNDFNEDYILGKIIFSLMHLDNEEELKKYKTILNIKLFDSILNEKNIDLMKLNSLVAIDAKRN